MHILHAYILPCYTTRIELVWHKRFLSAKEWEGVRRERVGHVRERAGRERRCTHVLRQRFSRDVGQRLEDRLHGAQRGEEG